MSTIQWKIITIPEGLDSRCIRLQVDESLAPLSAFFFLASESDYPRIIESALQGVGSGFDSGGVTFPNDLDEYDEPMDTQMVELYDPISTIQISQTTFLQALLDVAEETLKIRQERGNASIKWEEQMKKAITALRLKQNGEAIAP